MSEQLHHQQGRPHDKDAKVYDFPAPEPAESPDTSGDGAADAGAQRVDPPDTQQRESLSERARQAARHPVVPTWLRSRDQLADAAKWVAGHYSHTAAYHAVRTPKYGARLALRAPRGGMRVISGAVRWAADAEGMPVRMAAVRREDANEYLRLSRQRDVRVRARTILLAVAAAASLGGALVSWALAPAWALWLVLVVLVAVLGVLGAPADRPLIDRAVVATRVSKLTSDVVIRALGALGIGEINKALSKGGSGISFPAPISRDGPGWRADVDLPFGVTVTDIMERRDRLASGLRRPLGCVWPEPASDEHAGRLVLWVGDQDMNKTKQPAWPLAKSGQADVFAPVAFGTDQRGRQVALTLMFNSVLIGAMPRQGKTFALRVLVLAAALDPRVQLRVFELKGTGDLSPTEKVAHHYGSGLDDATVESCLESMREIESELERRSKTIAKLPKSVCPENKVTPHLAARTDLRLHPITVVIDECQELFTHPQYGDEADRLATRITKLGPAMGVMLLVATQRPDAKSLPSGISANAGIRFCLRVMGQTENDMVLGTSMYKNGVRATTFTSNDKGIGYLVGAADDPQIARAYYLDAEAADKITDRARGLREAAGTLSGHAIGHGTLAETAADTLLEDILTVTGPKATGADRWNETIAARLASYKPDTYGNWGPEQLTTALRPHGIRTAQMWGTDETGQGRNRRGIDPDHVTEILTKRNQKRGGG